MTWRHIAQAFSSFKIYNDPKLPLSQCHLQQYLNWAKLHIEGLINYAVGLLNSNLRGIRLSKKLTSRNEMNVKLIAQVYVS